MLFDPMALLILIVDDDSGIRVAVSDYLEICGYSVITAANGKEALSLLDQYHPHLLISDIRMPMMDGYDLVKQIRKRPEFRIIPVIFLTDKNSTEARIKGYTSGCDLYLPKPFEMAELAAIIRSLLDRLQNIQAEWRLSQPNLHETEETKLLLEELNLTVREKEVLILLTQGLSNSEIGDKLFLSPRTIEKYVSSLLKKTNLNNRKELLRFSLENQLVE
jgi:DNA-binding NarL/FixJ family response regulator